VLITPTSLIGIVFGKGGQLETVAFCACGALCLVLGAEKISTRARDWVLVALGSLLMVLGVVNVVVVYRSVPPPPPGVTVHSLRLGDAWLVSGALFVVGVVVAGLGVRALRRR
jgi:hypothetical protein